MSVQLDISELSLISSKLPEKDLERFLLKWGYEQKDLEGLQKDALLQLVWQIWDTWETKYKQEEHLRIVARNMCQSSFEFFVRLFWDEVPLARFLLWNWHMSVFCDELSTIAQYIFRGERPPYHLICNVAPGTSKSSIWSILFHCWVWCVMPGAGFISASHTHSLVLDLSARTRDTLKGPLYQYLFPEIEFSESQDAKGHFRNTKGGERFVCTVSGASPMGKHCSVFLIDDPINPEKALTEDGRRTAEEFITRSASTRRIRGKGGDVFAILLVMQRLGQGDPTDVMLKIAELPDARPVRHICLPAEITDAISPPEYKKYYEGYNTDGDCVSDGLMDPVRLSRRVLKEQYSILGSWAYAGQFLQSPRPLGGGMFKRVWFNNRLRAAPYNCKRIRYWDRAASKESSACATAGVLMAYDGDKFYVEDVAYGRWEPDERNAMMLATAQKDRSRYGKYEPIIYVEHEGGSTGKESFLYLVRLLARNGFTRVRQDVVTGKGGKDTRAEPWADQLASGNVFLIESGWDIDGYITDHEGFRPSPSSKLGREKDRVDASSGSFNLFVGKNRAYPVLQTFNIAPGKDSKLRFVVCTQEELDEIQIDEHTNCVVVYIDDPLSMPQIPQLTYHGAMGGSLPKEKELTQEESILALPVCCATKSVGTLQLRFADLDSATLQESWDKPVEPYGQLPEYLVLQREAARKLWQFLLKKRDNPWGICIIVDLGDNDNRALSVAAGLADGYRLPRSVVYRPSEPDTLCVEKPPNQYVYEQVKATRNLVQS